MSDELNELALELRRHLAWQEADGSRVVLADRAALQAGAIARPAAMPQARPVAPARPAPAPAVARPVPAPAPLPITAVERRPLDEIRRELGDCQRCKLCKGRNSIVFGAGNPRAELVFVGEGPGEEEDKQGVPFVGKAGQLLTKMIEAMKFSRDDVYICNVVKCRPPNNRNPEPDEIEACEPFLKAQLASLQPKVIVALGKFAAQTLLRDQTSITRLRGQWREYQGIPLMPTFHPAYLLRQPEEKKLAWLDLQEVMKRFGRAPEKKGQ
ncbi:MAG: uracil-DNA glycosylase [Myxococcaceae bacterium]|nr:uracil-DNA glycosylase [Myxococcaceae bacterium]